jgi:heterodisulfide reductase subunit A
MGKTAIIIGGGPAGMETASQLARIGIEVDLIEKASQLGGHLNSWDRLFPNRRDSREVSDYLEVGMNDGISLHLNAQIDGIYREEQKFIIRLLDGNELTSEALIIATGY